jgi:hypothetical protein
MVPMGGWLENKIKINIVKESQSPSISYNIFFLKAKTFFGLHGFCSSPF